MITTEKSPEATSAQCLACGAPLGSPPVVAAKSLATDKPVAFRECKACGCLFAEDAAELAEALYRTRESTNFAPRKLPVLRHLKQWKLKRDYLGRAKGLQVDRIVDFGCGNGDLANALAGSGLGVLAVDVPLERPAGLAEGVGYRSVKEAHSSFGEGRTLIILRHVLEHFVDPVGELERLARQARSGDFFIVETPTSRSLFRRLMGPGWPGYFPPFHVTVPNAEALRAIAERAGLVVEFTTPREPAIVGTWLTQKIAAQPNLCRLAGLTLYPLQWLASTLSGRSEAVEVLLRKP